MKLFGLLGKPAWEHKNASVRLRAVQSGHEPELLALLAELAQRDPDPEVRAAALRRVDDPALLLRRMRGEHETKVAAAARERLLDRLCADDVAFDQVRAALQDLHDVDALAEVATRAGVTQVRRAALERIARPGFLFERCLQDPDPAIRLWLVERIDRDALPRLADAARKRDKRVTRAARERLEALQLAAGDVETLSRRALALAERLSRLARELPADRDRQLQELERDWQGMADKVGADVQRRVEGFLDSARAALAGARGEKAAIAPCATAAAIAPPIDAAANSAPDGEAAAPPSPDTSATAAEPAPLPMPVPELNALHADLPAFDAADVEPRLREAAARGQAIVDQHPGNPVVAAQWRALQAAIAQRRSERTAQENARLEQQRKTWLDALHALENALRDGNVNAARAARQGLDPAALPGDLRRRLAAADEQIDKLGHWQRWSGNKVRARLCDDAEALHGSGLHPDAVANRIKELQAEWARLDQLEGANAPAADSGIARRFRALCHRALAPARGYFEKRRELRDERAAQLTALLAETAAQLEGAGVDALLAMRKRITEALRELDGIAPQQRGEKGRALRERLTRIDQALAAAREEAVLAKRRLLAKLRRDLGNADGEGALSAAKQAQSEWKRLARGERRIEDELWAELRGLIDPLFAKVRERETVQREQDAASDAAARAVLAELDALATADAERLVHADAHLDALATRWRALQPAATEAPPQRRDAPRGRRDANERDARPRTPARNAHPLEARFDAAVTRVQQAQRSALAARERRTLDTLCAAGALLDRLQAATDEPARLALREQYAALDLPLDARTALLERVAGTADAAASEPAEVLAVRAELAAGLESPAAASTLRRQEQMRRLASKLEGGATRQPAVEIRALLIALCAHPGIEGETRAAYQQRILRAYEAVTAA